MRAWCGLADEVRGLRARLGLAGEVRTCGGGWGLQPRCGLADLVPACGRGARCTEEAGTWDEARDFLGVCDLGLGDSIIK